MPDSYSNHIDRFGREKISLVCEVRQGLRPWFAVRLDDISPSGFKIAWLPHSYADQPIKVRIPGLNMLTANIRWARGNALGCEFSEALHVAVFEHIVRQARAAAAA